MSERNITHLRNHLFDALDGLSDKDHPMDIARAEAIAKVAQAMIHSCKVENDYVKLSGAIGSGFIPELPRALPAPGVNGAAVGESTVTSPAPGARVIRHRLR